MWKGDFRYVLWSSEKERLVDSMSYNKDFSQLFQRWRGALITLSHWSLCDENVRRSFFVVQFCKYQIRDSGLLLVYGTGAFPAASCTEHGLSDMWRNFLVLVQIL
jgi:hypothetical protein